MHSFQLKAMDRESQGLTPTAPTARLALRVDGSGGSSSSCCSTESKSSQHDEQAAAAEEETGPECPPGPRLVEVELRHGSPYHGTGHHATLYEVLLFFACGAGSSLCYISTLSSLVYFQMEYGADSYVYLNLAIFVPLVPVALAQASCDQHYDRKIGSARAFLLRGIAGFVISIAVTALVPLGEGLTRLCVLCVILGSAGAVLQGTLYQMSAFVSTASDGRLKAAVSSGIQISALLALIASIVLGFLGATPSEGSFRSFFFAISGAESVIFVLFLKLMCLSRSVAISMERRDSSISLIDGIGASTRRDDVGTPLLLEEVDEEEGEAVPVILAQNVEMTYLQLWRHSALFCTTLLVTLIPSFLVGSFFTHVKTEWMALPQVLFYDRIAADFLGRIFTVLIPPKHLLALSVSRLFLVLLFFINATTGQYSPSSDAQSVILVFIIAFLSGYLVTACYQLAPLQLPLEQRGGNLAKQASLLNVIFAFAALIGNSSSLGLLQLIER